MTAPSPSRADPKLQRRVLKRVGHLLELNADLDRNASDTRFAGLFSPNIDFQGKNYYVFDENIFELFLQPKEVWHYCANFYGGVWGREDAEAQNYSAQAGLIAAEYLFSGDLPGLEPEDPIFMTEWHFSELKNRLYTLQNQLFKRARNAGKEQEVERYLAEFDRHVHLGEGDASEEDLAQAMERASRATQSDARRFLKITNDRTSVVRFVAAREIARRLVDDDVIEPLEQLNRVYSELLAQVRPLSSRFQPELRDRAELNRLIEDWKAALSDFHPIKDKPGRIEFDAKSIAYVHWIARRRLSRSERIMLVTGDTLLYQAYSAWHVERPIGEREAFLLRRVNQYSPLINPHDTPNDIRSGDEGGYQLFDSIRRAMDAPLVSFSLRWEQGRQRASIANLLRTSKTPEAEPDIQSFTHGLTDTWWLQRDSTFEELCSQWREAERLAIGASLPVLERRLHRRQSLLTQIATAPNASRAFSLYLEHLLDDIAQNGLTAEFPNAIRMIAERPDPSLRDRPRAPLDVRLQIPAPDQQGGLSEFSVAEMIELWMQNDKASTRMLDLNRNPALAERLDIVYGVAAALAMRTENWTGADRFAQNAITAAEMVLASGHPTAAQARLEYMYLSALAKRFVIASTNPERLRTKEDVWRDHLEHALDALHQVEEAHRALRQPRRVLRAISERVAVRLFHATWKAVIGPKALSESGFDPQLPLDHYGPALADIRRGWACFDTLKREGHQLGYQPLNVNAASYMVIRELLARHGDRLPGLHPAELDRIEGEIEAVIPMLDLLPHIVSVDAYAFLWLVRNRATAEQPFRAALRGPKFRLQLDDELAAALRRQRHA